MLFLGGVSTYLGKKNFLNIQLPFSRPGNWAFPPLPLLLDIFFSAAAGAGGVIFEHRGLGGEIYKTKNMAIGKHAVFCRLENTSSFQSIVCFDKPIQTYDMAWLFRFKKLWSHSRSIIAVYLTILRLFVPILDLGGRVLEVTGFWNLKLSGRKKGGGVWISRDLQKGF